MKPMTQGFLRAALPGGLALALVLGGCGNPTNETGDIDTLLAAARFRGAYRAVLEKTTNTLNWKDRDAIDAALAALEALGEGEKAELTGEKTALDSLTQKLDEITATVFVLAESLGAYLGARPDNTPEEPYAVQYFGSEPPSAVYAALKTADRYVALDFSENDAFDFFGGAEAGMEKIVSLTLPDSLTVIPDSGPSDFPGFFSGFTSLKTLRARGLVKLGFRALSGCAALVDVDLPELLSAADYAFSGCSSLTAIIQPKLSSLGQYAFQNCAALETAVLISLTPVAHNTFNGCSSLITVELPEAASVGLGAFSGCSSLEEITLPKAASFGMSTFGNCGNLVRVNLPNVTSIGSYEFDNCTSLETLTLGNAPPAISERIFDDVAAAPGKTVAIKVPAGRVDAYKAAAIASGKTWADVTNKTNAEAGYFWDNMAATRDYLTVKLEAIDG